MAKCLTVCGGGLSIAFGVTEYLSMGTAPAATPSTTESDVEVTYRSAGTLNCLFVRITANSINGATTFKSRTNRGAANLSVSVGSSTTGAFEDATNSDAITAADESDYAIASGGSSGTMTMGSLSTIFDAQSSTVTKLVNGNGTSRSANSTTQYYAPQGNQGAQTVEGNVAYTERTTATIKNLQVNITANTRVTATTFGSRKNTANGSLSISVGAGITGIVEDIGNSDSLVATDTWCYFGTTSTGGFNITIGQISSERETTNNKFLMAVGNDGGNSLNFNNTAAFNVGGNGSNTSEANRKVKTRLAFRISDFVVNVTANTITTSATTFTTRKNGANTTVGVSIGAGVTGIIQDTTNVDNFGSTDDINHLLVIPNTSGAISVRGILLMGETIVPQGTLPLMGVGR